MKNAKVISAKRSFFMSVLSLILCFAMLLGTTYAWFTDEVTSGVNQIKAGNLDIEVSYKPENGSEWVSIKDVGTLFDPNALWEPGHTEFVTLKIENKGTLALNYKMMVSPVTETGGVNVSGQSFKLSDYLMFGVNSTTADPNYSKDNAGRTAARNAATGTTKLNAITKSGTMAKGADPQYVTLVVYMPENVGNEANYKTGTTAPKIELGIKVIATQLEAEKDSFDENYDAGAKNDSFYVVGPAYNYFPQISTTVAKATSGNTEITYSEKLNKDDAAETTLVKATVPADALEEGVESITVTVKPQEAAEATTASTALAAEISAGREVVNFDVKISGVKENNTVDIPMEVFVGTGLSNVKVYHNGTLIEGATYASATGIAKFNATTFSDYSFAYDAVCARIGEKTYGSLELAFAAANANDTITLLKDIDAGNAIAYENTGTDQTWNVFQSGAVTLDGDGHTLSGNAVYVLGFDQCEGAITIKNLTVTGSGENNKAAINLTGCYDVTLENVKASGMKTGVIVNNSVATIKGANTNIANGEWHAVNVDAGGTGGYQTTGKPPMLTVEGGTIGYILCESTGSATITGGNIQAVGKAEGATGTISITGGTFSSDPSAYVADGYKAVDNGNGTWTVGEKFEAQIGSTKYKTLAEAATAANAGDTIEILCPGTYPYNDLNAINDKAVTVKSTLSSNEAVVLERVTTGTDLARANGNGNRATFENLTVKFADAETKNGITHNPNGGAMVGNVKFKNCVISGFLYGYDDMTFTECKFVLGANESKLNMTTYGANVTYTKCTFDGSVNVYWDSITADRKIVFDTCTFNKADKANDANAAVFVKAAGFEAKSKKLEVEFIGEQTLNGYENATYMNNDEIKWNGLRYISADGLWQVDDLENAYATVKVKGESVFPFANLTSGGFILRDSDTAEITDSLIADGYKAVKGDVAGYLHNNTPYYLYTVVAQ